MTERIRYRCIDALRGVACMAVVLFHAKEAGHIDLLLAAMPQWFALWISHGDSGVAVFFVISGFVIANSMLRDSVSGNYVIRFLLRRSLHLDPPYWAAIGLTLLSGYVSARFLAGPVFTTPDGFNLLMHATYLVELVRQPAINTVFWTLCIEVQFYLGFALLMWLATWLQPLLGTQPATDLVLVACAALAALWLTPAAPFHMKGLFVEYWYLFIAGALVWRAVDDRERRFNLLLASGNLAALVLVLTLARSPLKICDAIGLLTALFMLVAGRLGLLARMGGGRLLQWLGLISYSLYLTHNTVTGAGFRLFHMLAGDSALAEAAALVGVLAACCGFAWLFYQAFEKPGLRWSKRLPLRSTGPPPVNAGDQSELRA